MSDAMDYVLDLVNAEDVLPEASLDYLSSAVPSASVMRLPGQVRAKTYIDGSGYVETPFAIDVRADASSEGISADIMRVLVALEEVDEHDAPVLDVYGESTPSIVDRDRKGNVIWRATGVVRWTRGSETLS